MILIGILIAAIVAVFVVAVAGPDDHPAPPFGWFLVVFMAELCGLAIGTLVA